MATYIILNIVFMLAIMLLFSIRFRRPSKAWIVTFIILLALTAVFDNLIIAFDIVDYDPRKILNIFVGIAPIEDFMYAVLAVILIPVLWKRFGATHVSKS